MILRRNLEYEINFMFYLSLSSSGVLKRNELLRNKESVINYGEV